MSSLKNWPYVVIGGPKCGRGKWTASGAGVFTLEFFRKGIIKEGAFFFYYYRSKQGNE